MKWIQRSPKVKPNRNNDSITDVIAKIRGIKDVNRFLNPTENEMFDPYLMKNIEEASSRIILAVENNERIVLSYDPDADGITATTVMMRYLKNYTDNVDYIYGERNNGHGITEQLKVKGLDEVKNAERIELAKENQAKLKEADLLILIDSSSNDTDTCKKIVDNMGIDIIVLDHHEIERENPHVLMVNPQQEGCEYPNKQLSGAGVVFKTIQVIEENMPNSKDVNPFQYIDLVAVGMYADIMRIDVLENRYMIMHGMRNIKNTGLVRILKGGKVDLYKINCNAIGFTIAPLINGVARMDDIKLAIDILLEDDDAICKKLRLKMSKLNDLRKVKQKEIVEQYLTKVDPTNKALLVLDEQSSRGFNGIVAQQLSDKYKRPAIVGRLHKGVASGSFRSYGGFDFKSFILKSGLIKEAMGHPQAGGFEVEEDKLELLQEYIENNLPELSDTEETVLFDLEISVAEINDYIKPMEQFNLLTGNGFPKIIVRVNDITIDSVECIGKTQETVKFKTFDDMELIKFRVSDQYGSELGYFDSIDAVGVLSMNEFYNFAKKQKICTPQLMIESYQLN